MDPIDRIEVVATIIYCQDRVLLVYNENWEASTLPMTKLRNRQSRSGGGAPRWERGGEAALRNVREALAIDPPHEPGLLLDVADVQQSDRTGNVGHYQFQVYGYQIDQQHAAPHVFAKWLTCEEILAGEFISPTARLLTKKLMEASLDHRRSFPPIPAPRESVASVAIIRQQRDNQPVWLSQWNDNWDRYFLVGGHAGPREGAQTCIERELKEELDLGPHEYSLNRRNPPPQQPLVYSAWSTSAWQDTHYTMSCFDVKLTDSSLSRSKQNAANRWLTVADVRDERCADDKLLSPTVRLLLETLGEV